MGKFIFGAIFLLSIQYSTSAIYTLSFEHHFMNKCMPGQTSEKLPNLSSRFRCIYREMGLLKIIGDIIMYRPMYYGDGWNK